MENNIYFYIEKAKLGDKSSMEYLINKFQPLINKYSYKLIEKEDGKSELTIKLIGLVKRISFNKEYFKEDKYLISYIKVSLKREYIYLSRKQKNLQIYQNYLYQNNQHYFDNSNIIFNDLIKKLNKKERVILTKKYIYGMNCSQIGKLLNLSRQNVYMTEKRALKKLAETI